MSKFQCLCGHIIRDQQNNLPYKAKVIANQDDDLLYDYTFSFITNLVEAREQGNLEEFLREHFGPMYPTDLPLGAIIADAYPYLTKSRRLYECEQCGRLWLQAQLNQDRLVSYVPESKERGVLRSVRTETPNKQEE